MTLKFFRLIPTSRVARPLALAVLSGMIAVAAQAQDQPSPTPTPKPKLAYIRFWNMLLGQPPPILELLSAEKPLATATVGNFYASYFSVTPGAFTLTVRRAGDQNGAIKRLPVNLSADMFVTILVSSKDGQPRVDYIDDTIDPKVPVTKRLVLRQLFPNAKVTATVGSAPPSAPFGFDETIVLDNLPTAPTSLVMQAVIQGQGAKSWSMPLDFSQCSHATLLIFPDFYGRFRPRVAVDGQAIDRGHQDGERR